MVIKISKIKNIFIKIKNNFLYTKHSFKKENFSDYDNKDNYFNEEIENIEKNILFYNMEQKRNDEDEIRLLENISIIINCLMIFFTILICFYPIKILLFFSFFSIIINIYLFYILTLNKKAYYKKWAYEDR